MKVIFWGTPLFAVPVLETLHNSQHEVSAVISQPDKISGRRRKKQSPPVVEYANSCNIPVLQPEKPKNKEFYEHLTALAPDVMVVVAYGHILSKKILAVPNYDCINVHFSILPAYRGASPITAAILNGETETGISIMRMVRKMDAGPVYRVTKTPIGPEDTTGDLQLKLGNKAGAQVLEVLEQIMHKAVEPVPQDETCATYCKMLTKQDGKIDWSKSASYLARFVRAMSPWPTAHSLFRRETEPDKPVNMIIHNVAPLDMEISGLAPGSVVKVTKDELIVACGQGALKILQLQRAGKASLSTDAFLRGISVKPGDIFFNDFSQPDVVDCK